METSRHECADCTFVEDANSIFLYFVSRYKKENVSPKPVYVGKFTMPGWTGHSSFYLFRCLTCQLPVIDYPHGYRGEFLYIRCNVCRYELVLNPRKYKEIYSRDDIHVPRQPSWLERRRMMRILKKHIKEAERIREMGIVPMIKQPEPVRKKFFRFW